MAIPFVDLKAQYHSMKDRIDEAVLGVLAHGQYIMGPEVARLEKTLAEYTGAPHAVGCSSGTDAIELALRALDIGPGDAVFTTPFTFVATAEAIRLVGATPVFVDIDPLTWNLDPNALEEALLDARHGPAAPRAVIAVDLYGLPADYPRLAALCLRHGLALIADAAQSFGGSLGASRVGTLGDLTATSFFPAKPFGCYGDGGMAFTADAELAAKLDSLRVHGKGSDKYDNVRTGRNARLDTLQAAILLAKFPAFAAEVDARQRVAAAYSARLRPLLGDDALPLVPRDYVSAWAQYTVRVPASLRPAIQKELSARGVPSMVYYAKPLHLQQAFADLGHTPGDFYYSEQAADTVLSLPFGPYLDEARQEEVCRALEETARLLGWPTA